MTQIQKRKALDHLAAMRGLVLAKNQLLEFLVAAGFQPAATSNPVQKFSYGSGPRHFVFAASDFLAIELFAVSALAQVLPEEKATVSLFLTPDNLVQSELLGSDVIISSQPGDSFIVQPRHMLEVNLQATFTCEALPAFLATINSGNALAAASFGLNSINALRQQLEPGIKVHIILAEGGKDLRFVPSRSVLSISVLAQNQVLIDDTVVRLKKCLEAAALMAKTEVTINNLGLVGTALKENRYLTELFYKHLSCKEDLIKTKEVSTSTYLGEISQTIPVLQPSFQLTGKIGSDVGALSEGEFTFAEAMLLSVLDLVSDPDLLRKITKEHAREVI